VVTLRSAWRLERPVRVQLRSDAQNMRSRHDAPGLHTVATLTDHICTATVCKDGALIAHRNISADVTPIKPLHTTLTPTSQPPLHVRSACRCALGRSLPFRSRSWIKFESPIVNGWRPENGYAGLFAGQSGLARNQGDRGEIAQRSALISPCPSNVSRRELSKNLAFESF
jgi:hypothetical protein